MYLRGFLSRLPLPGQGVSDFDATAIPEEVEFPREDILQELAIQIENLQQTIQSIEKQAEKEHLAKIQAEELALRRGELLEDARKEAVALSSDKKYLLAQISDLQRLKNPLDDHEARQTMRRLYQTLEKWVMRHFSNTTRTENDARASPSIDQESSEDGNSQSTSYDIQGCIHGRVLDGIFRSIWAQFMLGFQGYFPEHCLRDLDNHIHWSSPSYIWQHWRLAMSQAAASAAVQYQYWDVICDDIVHSVETEFSDFSTTDREKRTAQLQALVRKCYEFKKQLERQEYAYIFWCSPRGVAYNNESMRSLTGEEEAGKLVGLSLWPGLWRVVRPQEWEVVEREVVRTFPTYSAVKGTTEPIVEEDVALLSEMYSKMEVEGKQVEE